MARRPAKTGSTSRSSATIPRAIITASRNRSPAAASISPRPNRACLLLKAIGMVPHTGGRRFKPDSEYYSTLLHWIQAGAPDDSANVPQIYRHRARSR